MTVKLINNWKELISALLSPEKPLKGVINMQNKEESDSMFKGGKDLIKKQRRGA